MGKSIFKRLLRELFGSKAQGTETEKENSETEAAVVPAKTEEIPASEAASKAETMQQAEAETMQQAEAAPKTEAEKTAPVQEASADFPPKYRDPLGDGYYIGYEEVPNGYGYYCYADMRLYHDDRLIRKITDINGNFLDFPGVVHGFWEKQLERRFVPCVHFRTWISGFKEDGLAEFHWTVQPDGRYWGDDDGFGMENNVEIELCAKFNKEGVFVTPFWRSK